MKRERQPDVMKGELRINNACWITDCFVKGRRITLRNLGLMLYQEGNKISIDPIIYNMAQALRLLRKRKKVTDIIFTPGGVWSPTTEEGLRMLQPKKKLKTGMRYKG